MTAGHCGYTGHAIEDDNQNTLGVMHDSLWIPSLVTYSDPDVGYVKTSAGWTPTSLVNGYTDGVFSVSSDWAGLVKYPIGSTLCRYGQTTGGPTCATLSQQNVDISYTLYRRITTGLSILNGSCTSDGDSGGTWVGGVGQIQGIHIGGQPVAIGDACPTTFVSVFFQPIRDALDEFGVTMLTPHGSNAPSLNFALCPNMQESGGGHFQCTLKSADSQGEIEMLWTTSTGVSSTQVDVGGSCNFMETVNVTMKMTNPYGSTSKNYSFRCPMIPNQ